MTARFKKVLLPLLILIFTFVFVSHVSAAAPDGVGPWADSVLSSSQGLQKNGNPVLPLRSDPSSALGVAENNTTDGNFYSLGFGGNIILEFDNGISSGVFVVEATGATNLTETAKVEVSENGTTWVVAGQVTQDGSVNKPDGVTCAKYVRVTDISDSSEFPDNADGYDVDGVQATGEPCVPPTPTPCEDPNDPKCCKDGDVKITQKNTLKVVNVVSSSANTGGVKINNTTGDGDKKIKTGSATSNVTITTTGGSNIAVVKGGCCGGKTELKISGNAQGSKNTIVVNKTSKKEKKN